MFLISKRSLFKLHLKSNVLKCLAFIDEQQSTDLDVASKDKVKDSVKYV